MIEDVKNECNWKKHMKISSKQRKLLESLAHDLDPVVRIGKLGVTKNLIKTVDQNLEAQELIKVKILDNAEVESQDAAKEIVEKTKCILVRIIGRVLMLYRPHVKKNWKTIDLSGTKKEEPEKRKPGTKKQPAPKKRKPSVKKNR